MHGLESNAVEGAIGMKNKAAVDVGGALAVGEGGGRCVA